MRANRIWKKEILNDQKRHFIGVVVITKNPDNSVVPPSGKDAVIEASSGIFLVLAEAGEVNLAEVNCIDEKPTS